MVYKKGEVKKSKEIDLFDKMMQNAKQNSLPKDFLAKKVLFDHENGLMIVYLNGGQIVVEDFRKYKALQEASKKDREKYTLMGKGAAIHWQNLDEDLSVRRIILDFVKNYQKIVNRAVEMIPA